MQGVDLSKLISENDSKLLLLLIGGLGGVQSGPNMLTELQQAHRPHLNALVRKSISGLHQIAGPGLAPAAGIALQSLLHYAGSKSSSWKTRFSIKACAITENPAYQEICRACDFDVITNAYGSNEIVRVASSQFNAYDLLLIHFGETEKFGRQGGYYEKVKAIEQLDALLPRLTALNPDVMLVTGDYSCPTVQRDITWHPVPVMIHAKTVRYDLVQTFDEMACSAGALGIIKTKDILPLLLAHAGRLKPYSF